MTGFLMPNTPVLAVDLRCLQDENYRARGIGRHALGLLRHARACSPFAAGHPVVGLVDPALPPLAPAVAALTDRLQNHGYVPEAGSRFVAPSPMTHEPLLFARLATRRDCFAAAAVHDLIPLDEPGRYLRDPAERLGYHARLGALSWFRLFLPNSEATAGRLRALVPGLAPGQVAVTGVGLGAAFEALAPWDGCPAHVLAAGGADGRKNVELAVRAHGRCAQLDRLGVPLLVTGSYGYADTEALFRLHAAHGGRPGFLLFHGPVSDVELAALFRRALCVVVPSRNEGFSLPVAEAMAAHVPAFASDIPAHRELLPDAAHRFGVDEQGRVSDLMERALDGAWRAATVAAQAPVWPLFRAEAVARRFWAAVDAAALPAPPVSRRARPRVAFVTPLPPDRSGVADYSAATAAELRRRVDLTLVTPTVAPAPVPGVPTVPLTALPALLPGFDRVVNVMGNSSFHTDIFAAQLRHGGACICHDNRLFSFYNALLGRPRVLGTAAAELRRPVDNAEVFSWELDESILPATFLGEVAAAARPLFLHSRPAVRTVAERFGVEAVALPFSVLRSWTDDELSAPSRLAARRRLGVADGEVLIVSFGYLADNKAPLECLWALDLLRWWKIPARLVFVGGHMDRIEPVLALRDVLGLGDHVRFAGAFVPEAAWRDHYLAADVALQLRSYAGGLSGALVDAVAAGLPAVATADMADATDAPGFVRRVPDRIASVLVAEALAEALEAGPDRTRHEAERQAFLAEHNQATYSDRLCEGLGLEVRA